MIFVKRCCTTKVLLPKFTPTPSLINAFRNEGIGGGGKIKLICLVQAPNCTKLITVIGQYYRYIFHITLFSFSSALKCCKKVIISLYSLILYKFGFPYSDIIRPFIPRAEGHCVPGESALDKKLFSSRGKTLNFNMSSLNNGDCVQAFYIANQDILFANLGIMVYHCNKLFLK